MKKKVELVMIGLIIVMLLIGCVVMVDQKLRDKKDDKEIYYTR